MNILFIIMYEYFGKLKCLFFSILTFILSFKIEPTLEMFFYYVTFCSQTSRLTEPTFIQKKGHLYFISNEFN